MRVGALVGAVDITCGMRLFPHTLIPYATRVKKSGTFKNWEL